MVFVPGALISGSIWRCSSHPAGSEIKCFVKYPIKKNPNFTSYENRLYERIRELATNGYDSSLWEFGWQCLQLWLKKSIIASIVHIQAHNLVYSGMMSPFNRSPCPKAAYGRIMDAPLGVEAEIKIEADPPRNTPTHFTPEIFKRFLRSWRSSLFGSFFQSSSTKNQKCKKSI